VALIAAVVAIVVLALLVDSCQSSQRTSSLVDYNANVSGVMRHSDQTGHQVFSLLTSGAAARSLYTSLNAARQSAASQLNQAQRFSVPDGLAGAQRDVTLTLTMRRDAIGGIAGVIEPALGKRTSRDAISAMAADMARLYASDVVYKGYALPLIIGALHQDGIPIGGVGGQPVDAGQVVPDIRWLTPNFIASQLHVGGAQAGALAPGTHGHSLTSVTSGGVALQSGATLTAAQAAAFTVNFANTGQNTEKNVVCKVTLAPSTGGAADSGHDTVSSTTPGQASTCHVSLATPPAAGAYTVTATIQRVRGESDVVNNTRTYSVTVR
jgi:hypothetical protein